MKFENQNPLEHVFDAAKTGTWQVVKNGVRSCCSSLLSHAGDEIDVDNRMNEEVEHSGKTEADLDETEKQTLKCGCREKLHREKSHTNFKLCEGFPQNLSPKFYQADDQNNASHEPTKDVILPNYDDTDRHFRFRYISKGYWRSKMIVEYKRTNSTGLFTAQANGSGESIEIPADSKEIQVRFEIDRGCWCYLKKYDRFNNVWCVPNAAHIFRYDKDPVVRTFTIGGPLYYEAVIKVTNGYHESVDDM